MKKPTLSANTKMFLYLLLFIFTFSGISQAQDASSTTDTETKKSTTKEQTPTTNVESDGCTVWFNGGGFRDCCVKHDLAYFKSTGWRTRLQADNQLFMCVAKKGLGHSIVAPVMWLGVRIFGSPWFPIHKKRKKITK